MGSHDQWNSPDRTGQFIEAYSPDRTLPEAVSRQSPDSTSQYPIAPPYPEASHETIPNKSQDYYVSIQQQQQQQLLMQQQQHHVAFQSANQLPLEQQYGTTERISQQPSGYVVGEKSTPQTSGGFEAGYGATPPAGKKQWKRMHVLLIALLVFVALVAIGLGVGLGVTLAKIDKQADAASDTAPAPSSSTTSSTSTSTSPTSTSTGYPAVQSPQTGIGPGGVAMECPGAGGTTYASSYTGENGSTLKITFLRQCDQDYNRNDVANITAMDFPTCMNACTKWNVEKDESESRCVAVTWLYGGDQGTGSNYCWLKSLAGQPRSGPFWESAIILNEETTTS